GGTTWAPLGAGTDDEVENFAVFDDGGGPALFVGGDFLAAGGAPASYVAKWDGTSWTPLGTGTDDEVNVLFTFDAGDGEQLYVGGFFFAAGGAPAAGIARWDGTSWFPLGSGVGNPFFPDAGPFPNVEALASFDDGSGASLYAGGLFRTAGGLIANNFAEWACPTLDYGDAPDSYATLFASDGARHDVVAGFSLGTELDAELDGIEDVAAAGDDGDNTADEDGVTFGTLVAGATVGVDVEASAAGVLDAWVDWNADGDFDAGEKIFDGEALAAGTNSLSAAIPASAAVGDTFARFRFSSAGVADPTGRAADGEVEDYQVTVNAGAEFSIDDVTLMEGDSGTTAFDFTVTRSHNLSDASIDVATADTTAVAGVDYTALPLTTLSFTAGGALTQTATVLVNGDTTVEVSEVFVVNLSNPVAGTITDGTGAAIILNDDSTTLTINDATRGEAAGTLFFRLELTEPLDVSVSVDVTTVDGTATTADSDYVGIAAQTVTFPAGNVLQGLSITVNDDSTVELNESFEVELSDLVANNRAVTLGGNGTGTIVNDDSAVLTVSSESQPEAMSPMTFTATLSNPVDVDVTATAAALDGTATDPPDFIDPHLLAVSITAGETTGTFDITILDDSTVELDENFTVELDNLSASGRLVSLGSGGVGTIENDDAAVISVGDVIQAEDTGAMSFTISLSNPVDVATSVDVSTSDGSATTADSDYDALSGQTVALAAGETSASVEVTVNADTTVEADETFSVALASLVSSGRDVSLGSGATGTIENDDLATVSVGDVSQAEGAGAMSFTVSLSNPVDVATSVDVSTSDGSATTADGDYNAVSGQTVAFAAGETSASVEVTVKDDSRVEADETFSVALSSLVDGGRDVSLGSNGTGTIENDDAAVISIGDVSQAESAGPMSFTVSLSSPVDVATSVNVSTANGTATTADGDYDPVSGQTVSFAAGETMASFEVTINDDSQVESDETFTTSLSALVDGGRDVTLGSGGTGTIEDDDNAKLSIDDVSLAEGTGGTTAYVFTVSLSKSSVLPVTVDYATADGTAEDETGDGDYTAVSGTLMFAPGVVQQTINVTVQADSDEELDETFFVDLSGASGATISDGQGIGSIMDDDDQGAPVVSGVVSGEEAIEDCTEVRQSLTSLAVTFDQAMNDPDGDTVADDVTNSENYRLFMAGPNNDLDSEMCGDPVGDDVEIEIGSVAYDPGTFIATLTIEDGALLTSGPFRFLACDTLADPAGNSLDGGDFGRTFRIERDNLFVNGQFDCDVSEWELLSTLPEEISWSEDDVDDATISGSGAVTNMSSSNGFTFAQCLPIGGEASLTESAAVQVSAAPGVEVLAGLVCEFFQAEDCANDVIATAFETFVTTDTAGSWVRIESELASPSGASSALCSFNFTTEDGDDFDARVDDLRLTRPGLIFDDSFESGDTSAWSSSR
ncbi:MAG: Calx-beta domain-containing protein, partial [Acidobacteriota bacterium]